jgi:hypothetical protein
VAELLEPGAELPPRIAEILRSHAPQMLQTEQLARLRVDAPLPRPPHLATPSASHLLALREWFEALEFKSLLPRLDKLIAAR